MLQAINWTVDDSSRDFFAFDALFALVVSSIHSIIRISRHNESYCLNNKQFLIATIFDISHENDKSASFFAAAAVAIVVVVLSLSCEVLSRGSHEYRQVHSRNECLNDFPKSNLFLLRENCEFIWGEQSNNGDFKMILKPTPELYLYEENEKSTDTRTKKNKQMKQMGQGCLECSNSRLASNTSWSIRRNLP